MVRRPCNVHREGAGEAYCAEGQGVKDGGGRGLPASARRPIYHLPAQRTDSELETRQAARAQRRAELLRHHGCAVWAVTGSG